MELDETDRAILSALQEDARVPFSEIARRIDMSSATVHDRVSRMVEAGVIRGYHADVDPSAVGLDMQSFVGIQLEHGDESAAVDRLETMDAVRSVCLTAGRWDALALVFARDRDALRELVVERIARLDGVDHTETMVVLDTACRERELPLDADADDVPEA